MEIAKKQGEYRAVTRPTLGLFLNEECRMKNEEWELHFLLGKMGRGKNRADAMDEMAEMLHTYYIYGGLHTLYI